MRLALSGKGGTGKTTLASLLIQTIGRRGHHVLALDADSNPNLAVTLGLPRDQAQTLLSVPTTLGDWREDENGKAYVHLTLTIEELIEEYGISPVDNTTLLVMGTVDHAGIGCRCSAHASARGIMGELIQSDAPVVVADMEAGLEHLGRGTLEHADALLIIIEPYYRALEAGRHVQQLASDLGVPRIYAVANKIRSSEQEKAVRQFCAQTNLEVIGIVPYDDDLFLAENENKTLFDMKPESPTLKRIDALVTTLFQRANGVA